MKDTARWNRNIKLLALIRGAFAALFVVPVISLYWQRYGMDIFDIFVLQAIFALFVVILEIPTGFLADHLGRKRTLVLASVMATIGWGCYALADSIAWFVMFELLLGAAFSLLSGTDSAMLYESLQAAGRSGDFTRTGGHQESLTHLAEGGAALAGGLIATFFPLECLFLLTAAAALAALLSATALVEPPREKGYSHPRGNLYGIYKIARFVFVKSTVVRHVLPLLVATSLATMLGVWLYQPLWQEREIPLWLFGALWAGLSIPAALAGHYAAAIERRLGTRALLWLLPLPVLAGYGLVALVPEAFAVVFIYLVPMLRGIAPPVLIRYIHEETFSDKRATVLSIQSWLFRLGYFILGPVIGLIARETSLAAAFAFAAVWSLVSILVFIPGVQKVIRAREQATKSAP